MIKIRRFLFLLTSAMVFAPHLAGADEVKWLSYDSAGTTLTGTLVKETYKDADTPPALKNSTSWILKLETPVSLKADPKNETDKEEKNVKEVQLALGDTKIDASELAKLVSGKVRVSVTGSLFHAHTAYHVRPILSLVSSVKPAPAKAEAKKE